MFIGMMFCLFWVKECVHVECDSSTPTATTNGNDISSSDVQIPKHSCLGLLLDLFNFAKFGEIFKVIYTKRTGNKRLMLWLGYSVVIFGSGPFFGEFFEIVRRNKFVDKFFLLGHISIQYFFARHQFNYDEIDYSIFATISSVLATIGKINR